MARVRPAAVAGTFYPRDRGALHRCIQEYLDEARTRALVCAASDIKALIVPHAGYMYSGPVAASAFSQIEPLKDHIRHVAIFGPSHHVAFEGLAVPSHTAFETPLGTVPVDDDARRRLLSLPFVQVLDEAHAWEHSLEVQLPFLQEVLEAFAVLPVSVGSASPGQLEKALDILWNGAQTLIVVSSDLSHYHDYETAKRMDAATARAIESMQVEQIGPDDACGRLAVQGLLRIARAHSLVPETLDLRSSGDTAGSRGEVVGYGAWAFTASKKGSP